MALRSISDDAEHAHSGITPIDLDIKGKYLARDGFTQLEIQEFVVEKVQLEALAGVPLGPRGQVKPSRHALPKVQVKHTSATKSTGKAVPTMVDSKPASYASVAKGTNKDEVWAKVKPTRLRKREALILKKTGEVTYADMLRKMIAEPSLSEFGKRVRTISGTQQGELLLDIEEKGILKRCHRGHQSVRRRHHPKGDTRYRISTEVIHTHTAPLDRESGTGRVSGTPSPGSVENPEDIPDVGLENDEPIMETEGAVEVVTLSPESKEDDGGETVTLEV
ncbi:GD10377 [Drosophila simulans]|uniref:GD10377 n=1 Tax=Drosophila simulans TaxID=7240 RepID=B4QCM9_DROSI|nr:GD10377 [Drosophila simulans]